jgi:hypothetical protein
VHSERRATTAIGMSIFATAVAVSLILIASQDQPFGGPSASSQMCSSRSSQAAASDVPSLLCHGILRTIGARAG